MLSFPKPHPERHSRSGIDAQVGRDRPKRVDGETTIARPLQPLHSTLDSVYGVALHRLGHVGVQQVVGRVERVKQAIQVEAWRMAQRR